MKLSNSGEAQKHRGDNGGIYFLQTDTRNKKPYWVHKSGGKAIWWANNGFWLVGNFENLGKGLGGIKGPSNNDSLPNQITNGWQYVNVTNWHDTNGVRFEDWTFKKGKFLHSPYKILEFKQMSHDFIIS